MNRRETEQLLGMVAAICPTQVPTNAMTNMWLEVFKKNTYIEVRSALLDVAPAWHYPTMAPGVVMEQIKVRRQASAPSFAPNVENHCGRPSCSCTHTAPCDHGMIEVKGLPLSYGGAVKHCPTCHPDRVSSKGESRLQWMARLQGQDFQKHKRMSQQADYEDPQRVSVWNELGGSS